MRRSASVTAPPPTVRRSMTVYVGEEWSEGEADILRRYFTNLDGPVFALVNLPEVVKGALFARYSRSAKSLRRLFLDEFVGDLDVTGDASIDATVGLRRAEELYERVFVAYGDDSVAQLGGVHLACEQASNLLTKVLEWGRLASYLVGVLTDHVRATVPKDPADSDFVYRQATRAKALDATRGLLPAAAVSNVGIYGSGQAFEQLVMRLRAHPLPEARSYGQLVLHELRKVIPSFLRRVDLPDRGGAWTAYLEQTRTETTEVVQRLFGHEQPADAPAVTLVDWDPDAEDKLLAAAAYAVTDLPETQLLDRVKQLRHEDRVALLRAYVGERTNRRHKPGRAFERIGYRFDVLADYGAFRDLQRHRLLTIEWQRLTPAHGYVRPDLVDAAGQTAHFDAAMHRSAALFETMLAPFPEQAPYAVAMAYRVRFVMQCNAREAMHLLELRTAPQGHPSYRRIGLEMHRLIAEQAGHRAVAEAMVHITDAEPQLERLEAERRAQQKLKSR